MLCPNCNAPVDADASFCGNCGHQITPIYARGATLSESDETVLQPEGPGQSLPRADYRSQSPQSYSPLPPTALPNQPQSYYGPDPTRYGAGNTPPAAQYSATSSAPSRPAQRRPGRNIVFGVIIGLVVVLVLAGVITLLRPHGNGGTTTTGTGTGHAATTTGAGVAAGAKAVAYVSDSQNGPAPTNVIQISAQGLKAPPGGSQYDAWLADVANEKFILLGPLVLKGQNYTVSFTSHHNVLGLGNQLLITQDQGTVTAPTGQPLLTATFPPLATVHIKHLLLAFPTTPQNIGLLVGLRQQAGLLNEQAVLLKNAAANGNTAAVQCAAQSMIDIIEGAHGGHYQPLNGNCGQFNINATGDGFGLLGNGYIQTASAHATLAANQSDATPNIKQHANNVIICATNVKNWVTTIDQDAQQLVANPGNTGQVQDIATLANHAYNGVDTDGDGTVDPVQGEGGAITAYLQGQLMAALTLVPGSGSGA
jgi:hypothetical protein